MTLKPFYVNFDGLDVSFQGCIPQALVDVLETARLEAVETRAPALVEWNGQAMHVAESGARGGYAFRCDTGPTGATWFFSRNQQPSNWGIRVSAKSSALACHGLGKVRAEFYRFLDAIGATVKAAVIGRVDYCLDFLATDLAAATGGPFALAPDAFVMHSRTSRADHADEIAIHGISGRFTSVTCGKMPGRQIIVYDKSREVRSRQKPEWWAHWNAARGRQGLPALDGNEAVWRVELRAGKQHLKSRWGITTWEDLDNKLGDLLERALDDIRYTIPSATDAERFRWHNHPLWDAVRQVVATDLAEMMTGAEPGVVKTIKREQLAQTTEAMMKGLLATWTVATGSSTDSGTVADHAARIMREHVEKDGARFHASRERSQRKYRFIGDDGLGSPR